MLILNIFLKLFYIYYLYIYRVTWGHFPSWRNVFIYFIKMYFTRKSLR